MPDAQNAQVEILAFRTTPELMAEVERAARAEGLTKSAIARRAVIRDLAAKSRRDPKAAR